VSNDNPYSESAFKTLKYQPTFPERFGSTADASAFFGHPRTKFCRAEMKANNGVWNPITQAWIFAAAADAANALCALYQTTRPSLNQREALLEMAADGTGASAWDFDPAIDAES
jgi:hypothetical protein